MRIISNKDFLNTNIAESEGFKQSLFNAHQKMKQYNLYKCDFTQAFMNLNKIESIIDINAKDFEEYLKYFLKDVQIKKMILSLEGFKEQATLVEKLAITKFDKNETNGVCNE